MVMLPLNMSWPVLPSFPKCFFGNKFS
jgi:hypothetical protein